MRFNLEFLSLSQKLAGKVKKKDLSEVLYN